jgi:hypothetical protein
MQAVCDLSAAAVAKTTYLPNIKISQGIFPEQEICRIGRNENYHSYH